MLLSHVLVSLRLVGELEGRMVGKGQHVNNIVFLHNT